MPLRAPRELRGSPMRNSLPRGWSCETALRRNARGSPFGSRRTRGPCPARDLRARPRPRTARPSGRLLLDPAHHQRGGWTGRAGSLATAGGLSRLRWRGRRAGRPGGAELGPGRPGHARPLRRADAGCGSVLLPGLGAGRTVRSDGGSAALHRRLGNGSRVRLRRRRRGGPPDESPRRAPCPPARCRGGGGFGGHSVVDDGPGGAGWAASADDVSRSRISGTPRRHSP
jgi:hypothetical protein